MANKIWHWLTKREAVEETPEEVAERVAANANAEALIDFFRTQMRRMNLDDLAEDETSPTLPNDLRFLILAPVLEQLLDRIEQLEHRLR